MKDRAHADLLGFTHKLEFATESAQQQCQAELNQCQAEAIRMVAAAMREASAPRAAGTGANQLAFLQLQQARSEFEADAEAVLADVAADFQTKSIKYEYQIADLENAVAEAEDQHRRLEVRMASAVPPLVFGPSVAQAAVQAPARQAPPVAETMRDVLRRSFQNHYTPGSSAPPPPPGGGGIPPFPMGMSGQGPGEPPPPAGELRQRLSVPAGAGGWGW